MTDSPRNYLRVGTVLIAVAVALSAAVLCKHEIGATDLLYFRGGYVPWSYFLLATGYIAALGCFCLWRGYRMRANRDK
jgi:hypothetical protein